MNPLNPTPPRAPTWLGPKPRLVLGSLAAIGGLRIVILACGAAWLALASALGPSALPAADLPAYHLEMTSDSTASGAADQPLRITPDSILTVRLRPAAPVAGPLALKAFITEPGRPRPRPWTAHFERTESGAYVLRALVRTLPGIGPGRFHLTFLVGRPGTLPPDPRSPVAPGASWAQMEADLEVAPP